MRTRDIFFATIVAALLLSGCQSSKHAGGTAPTSDSSEAANAAPPTEKSQAAMTPQSALRQLQTGNARFVAGHPLERDFRADIKATASGQYPFAIILSCVDSRQPVEIVFDQGIGDIFSARVAGNVLDEDVLGSMEFACKLSGSKLIAVVGHSSCGAIKGAVDNAELGNLTGLLAKIKPAMNQVTSDPQARTSKHNAFVDEVAEANVRMVMKQISERSPVLREMIDRGEIGLAGGMYDVATGQVHFISNKPRQAESKELSSH